MWMCREKAESYLETTDWDLGFGTWDLGFGIWDLGFLLRLNVYATFQLLAPPAAGAWIIRVQRERRAWLAADARVTHFVEGHQLNRVLFRVLPHVACRP